MKNYCPACRIFSPCVEWINNNNERICQQRIALQKHWQAGANARLWQGACDMIHRLSYSIANWLGKQAPGQSVAVIAYGVEIFLITVIQLTLILSIAAYLGLFLPAVIVLLSFSLLRIFSGGKHLSTFWSCTLTDIILINGLAWISLKVAETPLYIHGPVLLFLTLATWIAIHRYAPLITVKRPTAHLQVYGRTYSKGFVLMGTAIAAICYLWEPVCTAAIVLGMAVQGMSITPGGCKALDQFDRWLSSYSTSS